MDRNPSFNPEFLKEQFNLHTSSEVTGIAARTKDKRGGKGIPNTPEALIQNYLDYLKDSLGLPDEDRDTETNPHRFEADDHTRSEKLARFKSVLHDKYVIKSEQIPESYFALQQRIAREQGHGDIEITPEIRAQHAEVIIADQNNSLDNWTDYLASPDATYPDWLRYWAMRSILSMGAYDKEKKVFYKRRKDTVKPFPDIDREALAYVLDQIEKKYSDSREYGPYQTEDEYTQQEQWRELLKGENFAKLYAYAIEKVTPASKDQLTTTTGEWIKYSQGSDHMLLVQSLQGHGTGWCTAGESTAQTQLENGDFYVYYSMNQKGQAIIPRAAIRMQENSIAEVRGIAEQQNLDPYIGGVVQQKLAEFPDGKAYEKKNEDMKKLTKLEVKIKADKQLARTDLIFLYEIDQPIQGFGYQKDPRIAELRKTRKDVNFDACLIFNCLPEQIAHNQQEVSEKTKAYIGPLFTNIFKTLAHLEIIFTTFPEGKIRKETITTGGKTKDQLIQEMEEQKIQIYSYAQQMMNNKDFTTSKEAEQAGFVLLKVKDMFGSKSPTTDELYAKAKEFGLELCQSQDGPNYRLHYTDQPNREYVYMGMKQIADADGNPCVFELHRDGDGLWLNDGWANPDDQWDPDSELVFRLSKYES